MPADEIPAPRWTPIILLSLAAFINYLDRGSLAVALPFVSKEMHLDPLQQGYALSAFSVTYALAQLPVGWLVDRYPLKWLYALAFTLWCLASAATGLASGLITLVFFRFLLGIGESVYLPGGLKFICEQFLPHERAIPSAIFDLGTKVGLAAGLVVEVAILRHFGWRWLFLSTGLAGLLWLLPWLLLYPTPRVHLAPPTRTGGRAKILNALHSRNAWGMAFGYFCWNYFWFLLVNWGPSYLYTEKGVPLRSLGWVAAILYLTVAASELAGGWLTGLLRRRGWAFSRAIKAVIALGFLIGLLSLPAALVSGRTPAILLLYLSATSGMLIAGMLVIPQQCAPPGEIGTWVSFQNFIGNIPGFIGPVITGYLVKRTGSFVPAFALAALICLGGLACYVWWVQEIPSTHPSLEADKIATGGLPNVRSAQ